jgi:hypothetical protein
MLGLPKKISPIKFWIFTVIYITISCGVIIFTTSGWRLITFVFITGPFYLFLLLYVSIICVITKQIRYTLNLVYLILLFQTIVTIFNLGDAGYSYRASACGTKNLIQEFFDFTGCGKLWIGGDVYGWMIFIYMVSVAIFALDIFILRSSSAEDGK